MLTQLRKAIMTTHAIGRRKVTLWALIVAALGIITVASVIALSPVGAREDPPTPPPPLTVHTQTFNRTLTIGNVTVELEQTKHSSETLDVEYSYRSSEPNQLVLPMINGYSVTRANGKSIDFPSSTAETNDGSEIFKFDLDTTIPEAGENIDISLGSYMVPAPSDVTGTANIDFIPDFGTAYNTAINAPGAVTPPEIPLKTELKVGERLYQVAKMTALPISFQLEIIPVNEAARKVEFFGVDDSAELTLSDNAGGVYYLEGGSTDFDDLSPRGHISQRLLFQGIVPPSATSLTLNVRGGGEIVGPFVFGSVGLVSEDVTPSGTPESPGDVSPGDPIPTPPNVNN